jgi:putative ABC transport system substrate-binding protein
VTATRSLTDELVEGSEVNYRRKLIIALGASALSSPFTLYAQPQTKVWRIGFLAQTSGPNENIKAFLEQLQAATKKIGITLVSQQVNEAAALESAFAAIQHAHVHALIVQHSTFTDSHRRRIVEFAAQQRLPAIFGSRGFVDVGGLMSYGPSLPEIYRRAAYYVDRIFKGAKPSDLPVEQPTKFELIINGKTAKALGLKIPQSLLISADKVIE